MAKTTAIELMIMSGPDDGTLLSLSAPKQGDSYIVGRREDCDVVLPYDSQVSRQHARVFMQDGNWYVQDLESRNGTYVGKQKIDAIMGIEMGQMFRVGRTWIKLASDGSTATDSGSDSEKE
jgi:pSer/pThr/pTyr-binding forkhead associated (FHA) protein